MSAYVENLFAAKIVSQGGVLYRQVREVRFHRATDELLYEVKRRGFHLLQHDDYYIILCGRGPMQLIT